MHWNKLLLIPIFLLGQTSFAQFYEDFNAPGSPESKGWGYNTGDGTVNMRLVQGESYASILIDATADKRNLWWAVIRRGMQEIDVDLLSMPGYGIRSEVKIKVSHAPRRVNLHFNHQRTTDYHSHLMEYDIPDTSNWHVISLTTRGFDAQPGDQVNAQMALMDWGRGKYRVDIDYFKVDVVKTDTAGPDLGTQLPYHPPIDDPNSFQQHVAVQQNAMIDTQYPDVNFKNWTDDHTTDRLLHVGGTQLVILRWDLNEFENARVTRSGLLELPVHSLQRSTDYPKDFGMVRISEIIGGQPGWKQQTVTMESFGQASPMEDLINEQMTIDYEVQTNDQGSAYFTISYPVLQRLIDGKTLGLSIQPLGAVSATFFSAEADKMRAAKLHFDVEE